MFLSEIFVQGVMRVILTELTHPNAHVIISAGTVHQRVRAYKHRYSSISLRSIKCFFTLLCHAAVVCVCVHRAPNIACTPLYICKHMHTTYVRVGSVAGSEKETFIYDIRFLLVA